MRTLPCLLGATLLLFPVRGWGQAGPPAARWRAGVLVESVHFGRALVDTAAPSASATGLRLAGGVGVALSLSRVGGRWREEIGLGWAHARPQADNADLAVTDKTARLTRWRLSAAVGHRLLALGSGELAVGAGPAVDWWRVAGADRLRIGGQGMVTLCLPVGAAELENRLGIGVSGGPFEPRDAGQEYQSRALLSLTAGVVVRVPL